MSLLLFGCRAPITPAFKPTNLLYTPNQVTIYKGAGMAPIAPSLDGQADTFMVSPDLPNGIVL